MSENRVLQLHKKESIDFSKIEDKYAFDRNKKVFSVSDGAGSSFHSGIWAGMITERFIEKSTIEQHSIIKEFQDCAKCFDKIDFPYSDNPAIAALEKKQKEKGSAATFIGVSIGQGNELVAICCGDSNMFIINDKGCTGFPHVDISSLNKERHFITTWGLLNNEIEESWFHKITYTIQKGDIIIIATDALSRYFFEQPECVKKFLAISDFDHLLKFCNEKSDNKEMEEDDITALIIGDTQSLTIDEILPPKGFKFPETKRVSHITQTPLPNFINPKDMQELISRISRIENNILQLQKGIKEFTKLLIILIALVALNIILLISFRQKNRPVPMDPKVKLIFPTPSAKNVSPLKENKDILNRGIIKERDTTQRMGISPSRGSINTSPTSIKEAAKGKKVKEEASKKREK